MKDIWRGVQSLLDSYAQIDKRDFVVILYTSDALEPAAWVSAALEQRGISYNRVWMLPLEDQDFENRLRASLPTPSELERRLVLISLEQDTMSHTTAIARVMSNYRLENVLALRGISAGAEFFSVALLPTPQELESKNTYLLERISQAKLLRITTPGGSDFTVKLEPGRHRWISNRGRAKPGGTVILPAGEVATYPVSVDGHFVADFAYNINAVTDRDVRLTKTPVYLSFEHGHLVEVACDDQDVMEYLTKVLSRECSRRVGELGFGTNFAVTQAIPMNSHVNERCPGVHLGLGQHNQDPRIVEYQCLIHLDLIARGGLVWADNNLVANLMDIPASSTPHPSFTTDEDVFSPDSFDDCCGVFQCDLALS
jgi:leucyl aminopeptidase (aminopeptidase T)